MAGEKVYVGLMMVVGGQVATTTKRLTYVSLLATARDDQIGDPDPHAIHIGIYRGKQFHVVG